jgi:hypothetical protein
LLLNYIVDELKKKETWEILKYSGFEFDDNVPKSGGTSSI